MLCNFIWPIKWVSDADVDEYGVVYSSRGKFCLPFSGGATTLMESNSLELSVICCGHALDSVHLVKESFKRRERERESVTLIGNRKRWPSN